MKKYISLALLSTSALALVAFNGVSVDAAKAKEATSNATIKAIAGEDPVPPVNPDKPTENGTDPGTNQNGPLQINYVSDLNFGNNIAITPKVVTANAKNTTTPYYQVSDLRGTGAGWSLKAKLSDFSYTNQSSQVRTIKGAAITFKTPVIKTSNDTNENPAVGVDSVTLNAGEANASQVIMKAEAGNGRGTWLATYPKSASEADNSKVVFTSPTNSIDTNAQYNATVTWELYDGPQGQ